MDLKIKFSLNEKRIFIIVFMILYINILRPFSNYRLLEFLIDLIASCCILLHLLTQKINKIIFILITIIFFFLVLSIIQIFNPNVPTIIAGLEGFRKTALPFIFCFFGLFGFKTHEAIYIFIKRFVIISIPFLLYGVKQYWLPTNIDYLYLSTNEANIYTGQLFGKERAVSFFAGPFHFGMFAAIITILCLYLIQKTHKFKERLIWIVSLFLSLLSCYCTLTRTNFVAMIFSILFYIILVKMKKYLFLIPFMAALCILIINYFINNAYKLLMSKLEFVRLIGTIFNAGDDSRFLGRIDGWKEILSLISKHPIIAYGIGSAGDTLQYTYDFNYHITSHDFYLKILMETGFIGLGLVAIFLILILTGLIFHSIRTDNLNDKHLFAASLSILSIFLVNSFVNSTIETYPVSGFLLMFSTMSLSYQFSHKTKPNEKDNRNMIKIKSQPFLYF